MRTSQPIAAARAGLDELLVRVSEPQQHNRTITHLHATFEFGEAQ